MRASTAATRALAALSLASVGLAGIVMPAGAAPAVPYSDPNAAGSIGICNQQNQQVTSGNIATTPFAPKVVSSVAAPSSVSGTGRTATLYAYQPIPNLPSGYWSGEQITGTSQYSNPAHPMAAATSRDLSLSQFLDVFPPKWDGFIELRLFLGAPGKQPQVLTYPALDLYISGSTWQAVGGASVDCTAGQAVSTEDALPGVSAANAGSGSPSSSSPGAKSSSDSSPATGAKSATGGVHSSSRDKGDGATADAGTQPVAAVSKSSNTTLLVLLAVAAVILIVIATVFVIRGRRRTSHP